MQVYLLRADLENFQNVTAFDRRSIFELVGKFNGHPVTGDWQPWKLRVIEDNRTEPSDFPHFAGSGIPLFSRRGVDELGDLLTASGELLPVLCDGGEYLAYNVTMLSDALDLARSTVVRYSYGDIMHVSKPVFDPERLTTPIFKLQELPHGEMYVTDAFVDRVRRGGLRGSLFQPV